MTIVKNTEWLLHQPICKVDEGLLANLRAAKTRHSSMPVIALFEAYLQVSDLPPVTVESFQGPDSDQLIEGFVGALYSRRFIDSPLETTYHRAAIFLDCAAQAGTSSSLRRQSLSARSVSQDVETWRDRFEALPLNEEQVWVKSGWGCKSKTGASICFPLYPIYERLGRSFTQRFAIVLEAWAAGRRLAKIDVLADFCRFFLHYSGAVSKESLRDPYWTSQFLSEFGRYYFRENKRRGCGVYAAARGWNSTFLHLVKSLVASGALAQPEPPIASIRAIRITPKGSQTHVRKTPSGVEVKVNLLTEVPLSVTDSEAKEILFKKIQEDFAACVTWAERDADAIWQRHLNARASASQGRARTVGEKRVNVGATWLTHPQNPDCLANCAATYSLQGHPGPRRAWFYDDIGLEAAAHMLGLPINGALLPHASILVANYPAITSAFLDTLELFDREGKICGVINTDAGKYLVGFKRRRGGKLAEQRFLLTKRTAEIVEQVIELTEPSRAYLKQRGNDDWRYLFLTVASVGANPKRQRFSDQCSAPEKWGIHGLVASFVDKVGIEPYVATALVRHFSLKNLRGSAAILIYLQTGDVQKMAEALGHKTYKPWLLEHYLPAPIQEFFNSRWIRIFQTAIICRSLQDSPYLLEASGFSSMEEVDRFLEIHALKDIPDHLVDPANLASRKLLSKSGDRKEVVFAVSPGILTMLLSIQLAVEASMTTANGLASFWAAISRRLIEYIQSLSDRPDLLSCLREAREHASPKFIEGLIHE